MEFYCEIQQNRCKITREERIASLKTDICELPEYLRKALHYLGKDNVKFTDLPLNASRKKYQCELFVLTRADWASKITKIFRPRNDM